MVGGGGVSFSHQQVHPLWWLKETVQPRVNIFTYLPQGNGDRCLGNALDECQGAHLLSVCRITAVKVGDGTGEESS